MRNGNNPEAIFRQILSISEAEETEVTVDSIDDSLTRFANNTIHQNVSEEGITVSVRVVVDRRTAGRSLWPGYNLDGFACQTFLP